MSRRATGLLALLVVAGMAACSSDEFGLTGNSLPLDVVQDSLAVSLVPAAMTVLEQSIDPDLEESLDERSLLFIGNRDEGGWRATPLMQFDFSAAPDSLDLSSSNWVRARIELEMVSRDADAGIQRDIRVHELTTDLTASMADTSLADVLGDEITTFDDLLSSAQFSLEFPPDTYDTVSGWITAGEHPGVALFDLTPHVEAPTDTLESRNSNFVGLASNELLAFSVLALNDVDENPDPELVLELADPANTFVAFPAAIDLTNLVRSPPADALTLGAHLPSRLWFQFDLGTAGVPSNATINRATLVLHIDPAGTLVHFSSPVDVNGDGEESDLEKAVAVSVSATGYRSSLGQASGPLSDVESILRATGTFKPLDDTFIEIDVTDYAQRLVNGVFENTDGILVSFFNETFELTVVDIFTSTAPVDTLRPRMDITYTPPADFLE